MLLLCLALLKPAGLALREETLLQRQREVWRELWLVRLRLGRVRFRVVVSLFFLFLCFRGLLVVDDGVCADFRVCLVDDEKDDDDW